MNIRETILGTALAGVLALTALGGCSKSSAPNASDKTSAGDSRQAAGQMQQQPQALRSTAIIDELKARLKEKPNDADTVIRLADAYFELKQFNESSLYYKKAIELKPGDAELYNDLGISIHYLGNPKEGLKYVEEGIKKNPYHQRIWLTKGFILAYGMGDLDGARAAWEKAKTLNPESQVGKAASDFLAQFNKKQ